MKKRFGVLLIGLLLLLSACTHPVQEPERTEPPSETVAESTTGHDTASDAPKEEPVKKLTDTDTPDKAKKLVLAYHSYDRLGLQYATGALGALYDGDINSRLSFFTPDTATSFNTAKLEAEKVIEAVKLFCAANYERNIGLELQASVDGKTFVTLYTLTEADADRLKEEPLVVEIRDSTAYLYFRVYHKNSDSGYDLNEVELYGGDRKIPTYQRVYASYLDFGDGKGGQDTKYIFGDKAGTEDGVRLIWDGVTDTTYCNFFNWETAGSYSTAKFAEPTVIGKVVLATIWMPAYNLGTAVQASVDGETWITLYVVSENDGDFAEGEREWKLKTLEIAVEDSTAYNYIRIFDTAGKGYCLAEVEIYSISE